MARTSMQEFFVGPNNTLFHIGVDIANGFEQRVSGIRDVLSDQNLRTICHDVASYIRTIMFLLYHLYHLYHLYSNKEPATVRPIRSSSDGPDCCWLFIAAQELFAFP